MQRVSSVGVIGAGIAGLACAERLLRAGLRVTVYEKSRGIGGRVATRRTDTGTTFDHGAQYFTVREAEFREQVQAWVAAGVAAAWPGRIVSLERGAVTQLDDQPPRYVGVPTMNAIAKSLAAGVDARTNVTVRALWEVDGKWQLEDSAGTRHGPYDVIVSTAPPPQSLSLVGGLSDTLGQALARVTMRPCWAVLLEMQDSLAAEFDGAFVADSPLAWIARNSSKPGRLPAECWVLHASAEWSQAHLAEPAQEVAAVLANEFWRVTGGPAHAAKSITAHRWRYALPQDPLPARHLFDRARNLAACGDWCGGPRVEGAFVSGWSLAEAILSGA
jgi:renalase